MGREENQNGNHPVSGQFKIITGVLLTDRFMGILSSEGDEILARYNKAMPGDLIISDAECRYAVSQTRPMAGGFTIIKVLEA